MESRDRTNKNRMILAGESPMQRFHRFCLMLLLTILAGCGGGGNVPLTGTVTFSDDGTPVPMGVVSFLNAGKVANGPIRDGSYVVGFEKEANGLPPGSYQVYVTAEKSTELEPGSGTFSYEHLIDRKYGNPDTSNLSIEVNSSTKTFDIVVDRAPAAPQRRR